SPQVVSLRIEQRMGHLPGAVACRANLGPLVAAGFGGENQLWGIQRRKAPGPFRNGRRPRGFRRRIDAWRIVEPASSQSLLAEARPNGLIALSPPQGPVRPLAAISRSAAAAHTASAMRSTLSQEIRRHGGHGSPKRSPAAGLARKLDQMAWWRLLSHH